jgi:hypothetical protein
MEGIDYKDMLRVADPAKHGAPEAGSPLEEEAIQRFSNFFSDMTVERVRADTARVYAEQAILHDTLKTHTGCPDIQAYFEKTAARAKGVQVEILKVVRESPDYYFIWSMDITWSAFSKKGQTTRSFGISHLRFDREGKVTLHHDFWDSASGFFEYLPLAGPLIRFIKSRV